MDDTANPDRTIRFTDRCACPYHGNTMVLVTHHLSQQGKRWAGFGVVTFFRCTAMVDKVAADGRPFRAQCTFMRPNKYQKRRKGERHK